MRGQLVLDFAARPMHALRPELGSRTVTAPPMAPIQSERSQMAATNMEPTMRPTLSAVASQLMIDAAIAEANTISVPVTVVVVDESGVLKMLLRMDGAPLVSVQTAINKAYSAAAIGMPPDDFYAAIESDPAAVTEFGTRPGLALIAGGLPVVTGGKVAGAVGVAGAMTAVEDRRIAEVAIEKATGR
jgi:uncharacterized protein GlcG (DUF336 family)